MQDLIPYLWIPLLAALVLVLVLARGGLLAMWWRVRRRWGRILAEDALKHVHTQQWGGARATLESLAGQLGISPRRAVRLTARLELEGWLRTTGQGFVLTDEGEELALHVIRAHRLWERYLADEAGLPIVALHREAERREHFHTSEGLDALEAALGHPTTDPHGDPIPTSAGDLRRLDSTSLAVWPPGRAGLIVHLEDEPTASFRRIAASGLELGDRIEVVEADAERVVIAAGAERLELPPNVAANVFVAPADEPAAPLPGRPLTALRLGESSRVIALDETLRGLTRRRLLDLGVTPGVEMTAEMQSMVRDPIAYRVRGSLIALRREQAEAIRVAEAGPGPAGAEPREGARSGGDAA